MNPDNEPLVAILSPVYNGAQTLARGIESVLNQTYRNWQYTIVNNRSTDDTLEIATAYAKKDPRIRVVTNDEFVGLIPNHNEALKHVAREAKYVKFLQGSYILFPECIAEMVAVAEKYPTSGVVCSLRLLGNWVLGAGLPYPSEFMKGADIARWGLLNENYVFGSPTTMLLRHSVIREREPFFNNANEHADEEAMYEIFKRHDFSFLHKILTFSPRLDGQESSKSRKLNTVALGRLLVVQKYGREFLSEREFQKRLKHLLRRYYSFIGASVLARREEKFWTKHREFMARIGLPLTRAQIAYGVVLAVADGFLNIRGTFRTLRKRKRT